MKQTLIFCEGVTDQVFIADCLQVFYKIKIERKDKIVKTKEPKIEIKFANMDDSIKGEIIDVGGCSKLANDLHLDKIRDNTELEGVSIVIFDADDTDKPNGNRGFEACNKKLSDIQKTKKVAFEHYIWPNHEKDGVIEHLLHGLIPSNKLSILSCIEAHQDCLKGLGIQNLRYAELKEKIGFYLHTSNKKSEARHRNYCDTNFWNLDINGSEDLKKFKAFLDTFFEIGT